LPHLEEAVATRPAAGWFEIHPENFLANPHATELLQDLAAEYPISVHSVGLSVGSASGIDRLHLRRLRQLNDRLNPVLMSSHLAWSTHPGEYLNDLLPLPYTGETLDIVGRHVRDAQDGLGRQLLIENPACYVGCAGSAMTEVDFLNELVTRTGCRILCDVSNVYLSAHNLDYDARAYLKGLPASHIGELHLGGFTIEPDDAAPGREVIIDTHADRVAQSAWDLYSYARALFGAKPTLIEWDNAIPPLATLLAEAITAERIAGAGAEPEAHAVTR